MNVAWAASGTTLRQKTPAVDGKTTVIMTLKMVSSGYAGTRDFAVADTDPADIAAVTATFSADFTGRPVTPPDGADLVWSPTNSQSVILSVINAAKHTLRIENEQMDDPAMTSALEAAARRGVNPEAVMTADSERKDAFTQLVSAGVHVRTYPDSSKDLYIHAKAVVADAGDPGQNLFAGPGDLSKASREYNRELGIRTTGGPAVSAISSTAVTIITGRPCTRPAPVLTPGTARDLATTPVTGPAQVRAPPTGPGTAQALGPG